MVLLVTDLGSSLCSLFLRGEFLIPVPYYPMSSEKAGGKAASLLGMVSPPIKKAIIELFKLGCFDC